MFEKLIAYYCGPSLAGIKPANIASLNKSKTKNIKNEISKFNKQLNKKDIYIDTLCECSKRILVIVYRKSVLEKHLSKNESKVFLKKFGYPEKVNVEEYIDFLKKRLTFEDFPHEIGIFLGYPVDDIYGYINNPSGKCLAVGEWKVYNDVENAKKLFCRYKNCRCGIIRRLEKGHSLERLFCAG